jgi:hypothetical protein
MREQRQRCAKKEEAVVTGSGMVHGKETSVTPGSGVVRGRRRPWRRANGKETEGTRETRAC